MRFLKRADVRLAFEDNNAALPPMLLVHGCGLDHHSLTKIADFFSKSYRVISVDLRGHGRSDAPYQEYTVPAFADDLAWLCAELTLPKVCVVGHSMGGNVALELAARHSELVSMIVMIDSIMLPSEALLEAHRSSVAEILGAPAYLEAYKHTLSKMCIPSDRQSLAFIGELEIPRHVLASALPNHIIQYNAGTAASACHVPIAYIHSIMPLLDLARFHALTPQLVTCKTLGSGHFSPIEIPDQINAMIAQFLRIQ